MSNKDYSKPVGWWCPACGRRYAAEPCDGVRYERFTCAMGHGDARCIPVFDPLPTPEPSDDEPDADTVVCSREYWERFGDPRFTDSVYRRRWVHEDLTCVDARGRGKFFNDMHDGADEVHAAATLADAVLWVAEGRLP